ncbi:hypothetical protein ACFZA2_01775 [Microbacterium sp. NPDC007973]|uniref:hypothetical protein n=1 Tax=Microbacterium sp. NPDC007973 TaxID=3364182 RepID=UPI0036E5ED7C
MATDDPNYSYLLRRIEELEQLLRANPLRSASVSRGTTEFRENSTLLITDSNMRVVGVAYVSGRLEGEGTFSWSGPTLLDGSVEITNTLDVLAATRLRGETTIEGLTRLLAELIVEGKITVGNVILEDGKIKAGGMTINPDVNGGQIDFGGGRSVNAGTGFLGLYDGDRFVVFNGSGVTMVAGGRSISVGPSGIRVSGVPSVPTADIPGSFPSALVADASGLVSRVVP